MTEITVLNWASCFIIRESQYMWSFTVVSWLSCSPLDPRLVGSNSAEDDGLLRAIKIRSTPSFVGEVKPEPPCRKILRHVKITCKYEPKFRHGDVVVSVLATRPKGRRFEPGQGNGYFRVIKIRSTTFFGWEIKPEVPCRKILRHVKDPLRYFKF
jgi:hypothetical protein